MIRIEPQQSNFLKVKAKKLQCKLPPVENYMELINMVYKQPDITYITIPYDLECRVVAKGDIMYHDFLKGTEIKTFYIVKATKGFYFMLEPAELHKYLIEAKKGRNAIAC